MIRALAPFVVGFIVPPMLMLGIKPNWSGHTKFALAIIVSLVLGVATSYAEGALAGGLVAPEAWLAILVDTSLVFTGSQLAYRLAWKPTLDTWTTRRQRDLAYVKRGAK